jgi:hypothetical protein
MGWFSNVGSKVSGWFKKTIGTIGSYGKKIGDFGMQLGKKIGEYAPTIGAIAGTLLDEIGAATANPELALLGESIRAGGNLIGSYANTGHQIASHVHNAGNALTTVHDNWGD